MCRSAFLTVVVILIPDKSGILCQIDRPDWTEKRDEEKGKIWKKEGRYWNRKFKCRYKLGGLKKRKKRLHEEWIATFWGRRKNNFLGGWVYIVFGKIVQITAVRNTFLTAKRLAYDICRGYCPKWCDTWLLHNILLLGKVDVCRCPLEKSFFLTDLTRWKMCKKKEG